ncbi:hypothetical protein PR003_g11085 [Phytophthora rubi]|uniref:Uncharacterized protein n=1 Tax=Phytophthora rubi TaxID=129364 RepID=A0A6A3MYC6_9STRA|nr:hypothetical protein PR001_g8957 [Phytophthora rubi]KAE9339309.1 hypothetical protein PR003_g11085 [Phytophthora rubi]
MAVLAEVAGRGGVHANLADTRLQGAASGGGVGVSGADVRLQGAASGGVVGLRGADVMLQGAASSGVVGVLGAGVRLQGAASGGVDVGVNTLSDCGRGEDIATVGLSSVASGDENVASNNLTVVTQEAYNGGIENGFVALTGGTASSGGGERSDMIAAADGAEGASSSAPKRKRGRPKGSKNKPRAANGAEPKRKRGRPAGSKASPKRSLTQAMGHAQTDAPTEIQPRPELVARSPQRVESAAASALENENDAGGHMLPGTTVPITSTPDGEAPRTCSARPPLIPALYVNTLVAFAPEKEGWTKRQKTKDKYVGVGSSYLVGRVCRIVKGALFHVQRLDSQYQNKDERLNLSMIQRGNANYRPLHGNSSRVG